MTEVFAAVDLTTVAAFVTGAMVIVVGVAMAFKSFLSRLFGGEVIKGCKVLYIHFLSRLFGGEAI